MAGLSSSGFGVAFNFKATGVDQLKKARDAQRDNIAQMQIGKQMQRLLGFGTRQLSMDILEQRERLLGLNQALRATKIETAALQAQQRTSQAAYAAIGAGLLMLGARGKMFLEDASRVAIQFEALLGNIATLTGETIAELKSGGIPDALYDIAKATMTTKEQVAEVITGFVKAGDEMPAALKKTETAMGLMAIAQMDAGAATRALVKINNLFKEQLSAFADPTAAYVSGLVQADRASVATAGEIQDMTERTASAVKMFGVGVDWTMAMSSAVLDLGGKVERSGTAMQNMFLSLKMRAPAVAEALGQSVQGFSTMEPEQQLKMLLKSVDLWQQQGNAGAEKIKAVTKAMGMPGTRGTETLMKLAEATRGVTFEQSMLGKKLAEIRQAMNASTLADEAMAERKKTLAYRIHALKIEWEKFKKSIGESVNVFLGPIIVALTKALELFNAFPEPIRHMVGGMLIFGTVAAVGLGTAALAAGGLSFLLGVIDRRLEAMSRRATLDAVWDRIMAFKERGKLAALGLGQSLKMSVSPLGFFAMEQALDSMLARVSVGMARVPILGGLMSSVFDRTGLAVNGVTTSLGHASGRFQGLWTWAGRTGPQLASLTRAMRALAAPTLIGFLITAAVIIGKNWRWAMEPFKQFTAVVGAFFRSFVDGTLSIEQMDLLKRLGLVGFATFLGQIGAGVRAFWTGFMEPFGAASGTLDMLAGVVGATFQMIADAFDPLINIMRETFGMEAFGGTLDALTLIGNIFGWVAKIVGGVFMVTLLAVGTALKWIIGLGITLGLAIAAPFRAVWSVLKGITVMVTAVAGMILGLFNPGSGVFTMALKDFANGFLGIFEGIFAAIGDVIRGFLDTFFGGLGTWLITKIKGAYSEVKQFMGLENAPTPQPTDGSILGSSPLPTDGGLPAVPNGPAPKPPTLAQRGGLAPKPLTAGNQPGAAVRTQTTVVVKTNLDGKEVAKNQVKVDRLEKSRNGTVGQAATRGVGG